MLTILYKFLVRFRRQDEITHDMLVTFEEARADARARGWISYAGFAIRELTGLALERRRAQRRWLTVAAWGLGGLAVGVAITYIRPPQYSSEAFLVVSPPAIPASLYPSDPSQNVDSVLSTVLSRTVLTHIINSFELYPNARARQPIEAVIERMRRDIRIERQGENVILVAFTYGDSPWSSLIQKMPDDQALQVRLGRDSPLSSLIQQIPDYQELQERPDRYQAQRVTQDLTSRVIDQTLRNRGNQAFTTQRFFEDRSEDAAKRWEKISAAMRACSHRSPV